MTKTGQLSLKEDKFNKALEENFDKVSEAITGEYGFANQLKQVVSQFTAPGSGIMSLREQGPADANQANR